MVEDDEDVAVDPVEGRWVFDARAVEADDQLIEWLSHGGPVEFTAGDPLILMLAAWRAAVSGGGPEDDR